MPANAVEASPAVPAGAEAPFRQRSQASLIAGIALITAALIFIGITMLNKADESRRVQAAVREVEAHVNLVRSLLWEAQSHRQVTFESQAEFRHSEAEILQVTRALAEQSGRKRDLEMLRDACADYLAAVNREMVLARTGQFDSAREIDTAAVTPSFRALQKMVDLISDEQNESSQRTALTLRLGFIAAALFSTATMLLYFHRFSAQHRRAELAVVERALALKNEGRFRTLTEHSTDVIMIADTRGTITYMSPSVQSVLGWKDHTLLGTNLARWTHEDDAPLVQAALAAVGAQGRASAIDFRLGHADGRWLDFRCLIRNLVEDANIRGLLLNARDVTQDKRTQEILDFHSSHDPLTELPNRAVFMDRVRMVIERRKRHPGLQAAVLCLDLDDLKVVNDSMGHDSGDSLIVQFGQRLRACVRDVDTVARPLEVREGGVVARLGGDEFIVLLEDLNDPSDAIRVAQRIQAVMAEPFVLHGQEVFKGVSIGISFMTDDMDARSLIANADVAMYRAKMNGKSRYEAYDHEMQAQINRRLDLEGALRHAVEAREFRLQFQPIVSLTTGRVGGLEALVRWERPGVGLVSPADFIPLAEEIGVIVDLGQWVLLEACRQAARWVPASMEPAPYVAVNVSARQFTYPLFVDQVKDALRSTGLDPHRLKVELTEGTAIEDPERALDRMLQLAELGVTLSLDDFGTGYSSLSALRRFPVKTIKIDRSFIAHIHRNSQVAAIVTAICGLARILCMDVVAEGLENVEQLAKLRAISCDYAQGYLLARPLPAEAIPELLSADLIPRVETERKMAAAPQAR